MKVIFSTGPGRLHLFESAKHLLKQGIDVKVITGWVPYISAKWIDLLGRMIGRRNLSYGFMRRRELGKERTLNCGFSEFYIQFLFILSRFGLMKREKAARYGWIQFGRQSRKYIKDAQIFHVRSGAGQGGAIEKARKKGMKILVDHSAAHPQATYNQLKKAGIDEGSITIKPKSIFWQLVMKDCEQADLLLVNSDYVKDTFIENRYDADNIRIVYLGVREDFFGLKKIWELNGRVKLLFTGGFGFLKGGKLILDAVKQLQNMGFEYYLDIVGSISMPVPDWVQMDQNIKLHGHIPQDDLKSFLSESDIYIFPSYSEGSAQSLKEAMAAGMPVIATYQSGAPIIHQENGYLIPDNSVEALKEAILELTKNDTLRKLIGVNASKTISQEHTWEKYADNVERVYQELLT